MIKLELKRRWFTLISTVGELFIDGVRKCFTLEDRHRPPPEPKVPHETCIPCGTFEVIWAWSPHFQRFTLRLVAVPDFSGVLMHGGNRPADTDGCVLVGRTRAENFIGESQLALKELEAEVVPRLQAGERCFLTITAEPH